MTLETSIFAHCARYLGGLAIYSYMFICFIPDDCTIAPERPSSAHLKAAMTAHRSQVKWC